METGFTESVIVVACVLLSGFFSSSEAAFLSVQRTAKLAHMVKIGDPSAVRVARMLDQPGRLLSTILLGNNVVNVAFTALITALILGMVEGESAGLVVATVVGSATLLLFGEVLPKTIAVRFPMGMAMFYTRPLKAVELLLLPLVVVLQWSTRIADIGKGDEDNDVSITKAEVQTLIGIGEEEGEFEPEEAERIARVFRFGDRQLREVMTPRTEIVFVEDGMDLGGFLKLYADHSHTRFPVYRGSTEDIIGLISTKDILMEMASSDTNYDKSVTDILRDVYFVPETKQIAELFDEMGRVGRQMAIAIDEFGGVAGLVTLKSLLEEAVGSVGEDGASPEEEYETLSEDTFQVDGGMGTEEAIKELGIRLPDGDFETMAGFVLGVLGHIPDEGQQFQYNNLKVEIARMNGLKIETIKLTKIKDLA